MDNVFAKEQVGLLELIVDKFNEKINVVPFPKSLNALGWFWQ